MSAHTRDRWQTDRLDLRAYLRRIGHTGDVRPDARTLAALHRAHVTAIPFENLDIVLGRPIELDLDAVQDKLVAHRRGGYCYEHGLLFAAALQQIGFPVTRLLARVHPEGSGARTHMTLLVEADRQRWLADVGFGGGVLQPIPLRDGATVTDGDWTYRLSEAPAATWTLSHRRPSGEEPLHAFTLEPQRRVDYAVANHYTSTHPRSPFLGQAVVFGTGLGPRPALVGSELRTRHADGTEEHRPLSRRELGDVLTEGFGIELSGAEVEELAEGMRSDVRAVR